ncbi:MAG TPA: asparagine synthase (glutamine-hydrolyzing) [Vicinamibacterales bacterium]|nr:asparagine synthase (glutamine-hydrolyzing) [Vicinamibacterales bacterium]
MCGIAGIIHTDARDVDGSAVRRMTDAMAHRGPDGSGVWTSGAVGLGHRRLAIIDLEGGRQPMRSAETGCVLTFNGEIYNYRELRQVLAAEGLPFLEHGDTEVVLRAYERWGDGCVDHLRGMFAFAVWDPRTRRLFAARDRLGIKPFYYRWRGHTLCFASELKAILAVDPGARHSLDPRSFDRYLRLQYVPAPHTMVEGVRQLRPGYTLTLGSDDGGPVERQYWQARARPAGHAATLEFQDRFAAVVSSHLVADVPVGALLSGGLDSSLVVAHMVRAASDPVHTFSVGFEDARLDERDSARRVAEHLGTVHHEHLVTDADAAEALPRVAAAMDEPLADYAAVPTYLIARFAAQHVKVVLTGEGADELFAGYRRYRRDRLLAPLARLRRAYQPSHVFSAREASRLLGRRPFRLERAAADRHRARGTLNHLLLRDVEGWLPDNLLVKIDRMTMLCSLEARVPYLDHEFVEYALGIPAAGKLRLLKGANKLVMREAAAAMVPEAIAGRPKQGFKPPVDAWLRGRLRTLAHDALLAPDSRVRDQVDVRGIRRLLADHDAGRPNGHRIWALLVHELWSREHGVV